VKRWILLPAAWVVDQILGDPEGLPHPVRLIGLATARGEAALRYRGQSGRTEFVLGAALTGAVVAGTYGVTRTVIREANRRSRILGNTIELLLGWTCLAARNLEQEAVAVTDALELGDLALARRRLARIVGRDTASLDMQEICRAVIETLAESSSDGVLAPIFYMALGGVPLAMAYKAVNTLDSMIGHADARYFYFGKAAARLDDAANYLPARLTAATIVAAASFDEQADPRTAWQTWRRDGDKHKSPNAGQPESAMAGALQVQLGGDNTYSGELIPAQHIGLEFPKPSRAKAQSAIRLVSTVTLFGVACGVLLSVCSSSRAPRRSRR